MRRFFFLLLVFSAHYLVAQDPVVRESGDISRDIVTQGLHGVEVLYSFPGFETSKADVAGYTYHHVTIPGAGKMREPGKPAMPALTELVAIPFHARAILSANSGSYKDYGGYRIHPALQPAFDTYGVPTPPFEIDSLLYQTDAFFPQNVAEIVDTILVRGMRVAVVQVRPVQYNPVTGVIRVHQQIRFQLQFEGANASFESFALENSGHFTQYLSNLLLNGASLPDGLSGSLPSSDPNYLILTIETFKSAADSLALWRQQNGYRTRIISKSSWTSQQIYDTVHAMYQQYLPRPDYLLILGDHNQLPAQTFTSGTTYYPTDLYFVCMDGSADFYPDMAKGRISVANSTSAMATVQKIINYERNPVNDTAFYQHALHCAYFQDDDTSGYATRRFTHTSEEIRDYVLAQGYDIDRVYATESYVNPTNYNNGYYSNGEPIPADLLRANGFQWNGGATQIAQAINNGRFYVLHRDHGYVGGSGWASPYFTTSSLNLLSNGNKLPVVFSINCHTGEFSLNECFAEKFLRLTTGGASGVVAASFASYSGYNDALSVGLIDAIWNNPGLVPLFGSGGVTNPSVSTHPSILPMGDVLNHGLLRMVQTWNGSTSANTYQYRLLHYFGDPAMKMFTASPSAIYAQVPDTVVVGSTFLNITGCNVNDALATVVYQGNLAASGNIAAGQAVLHFAPLTDTTFRALVTITKHNYKPYIKEVVVTSLAPSANNTSCQALMLPVKKYCDPVPANFAGADTASTPYPSCASYHGKDVWFSFVAPAGGLAEVEVGDQLNFLGLAAYTSGCNTPLYVACDTAVSSTGRLLLQLSGLIPGDTIRIRVWQNGVGASSNFNICVRWQDTFPETQIPYYTGFENGLDSCWQMISSNAAGRIRIDTVCDARYGTASLSLDQNVSGTYARNEAWLRADLRGKQRVILRFWWREFGDENSEEDGVYFSEDGGDHFEKVTEFKGSFEAWTQYVLDVDKLAALKGLKLTEAFVIKFQQYDNWYTICSNPTGGDGFAFDEIELFEDTTWNTQATIPYATGFDQGFEPCWSLNSSHNLGRIVATGAYGPFAGGYHLMMDVSTGSNYNFNTADLRMNLLGITTPVLSFHWKSLGNENHAESGVYFSDDAGNTFTRVMSLSDTNTYWSDKHLNIDALTQAYGLTAGNDFIVRFAQYDNQPAASDGMGFDSVMVRSFNQPLIGLWPIAMSYAVDTGHTGTKDFWIINPGGSSLTIDSIHLSDNFSTAVTLPAVILPGDSLAIPVGFSPDSVLMYYGQARVYHNALQGLDTIRLQGQGLYRELIPSVSALVFDTIPFQTIDTLEFQLTNPGNGTIAMSSITVPYGFAVLSSQSQNFSAGQTRDVKVIFVPPVKGQHSGFLTVNSDANQVMIPISGFAYDPLGVEEADTDHPVVVYPNPCQDRFRLECQGGLPFEATLTDMAGRMLWKSRINGSGDVDMHQVAQGVYILECWSEDNTLLMRTRLIRE